MDFISRETWGARFAAGSGPRPLPTAEAWLHHTVTKHLPVGASPTEERAQMRSVEAIGQQRFGQGFSYNLALFPSGRCYVGCGVRRVGSHTAGRNSRALGIVLVGDFDRNEVGPELRAALAELLRTAHSEGWIDAPKLDGGHRDLKQTACPGRFAYRLIPELNRAAAAPPPKPQPAPPKPPAPTKGPPTMLVVQAPNDARQFLCDLTGAVHISPGEKAVLVAAGVPYVGESAASDEARREFLQKRGAAL